MVNTRISETHVFIRHKLHLHKFSDYGAFYWKSGFFISEIDKSGIALINMADTRPFSFPRYTTEQTAFNSVAKFMQLKRQSSPEPADDAVPLLPFLNDVIASRDNLGETDERSAWPQSRKQFISALCKAAATFPSAIWAVRSSRYLPLGSVGKARLLRLSLPRTGQIPFAFVGA